MLQAWLSTSTDEGRRLLPEMTEYQLATSQKTPHFYCGYVILLYIIADEGPKGLEMQSFLS